MIGWRRAVSPRGAGEASPEGGVSAGFPEDAATLQRPRVSPGDWVGAKGLLDETAIGVLLDEGYPEHLSLSNAKIALGSLTCAFALIAHFFPKAHPHNHLVLAVSVALYFVGSALLALIAFFWEMEYILFTHPKEDQFGMPGLKVSSDIGRFSDRYLLRLETISEGSAFAREGAELDTSITEYFDAEGRFAIEKFEGDVAEFLTRFEKGKRKKKQAKGD